MMMMMMIKKREIHPASGGLVTLFSAFETYIHTHTHHTHTQICVYSMYVIPHPILRSSSFLHRSEQHVGVVEGSFVIITCVSQQPRICR
ncbi:Uncharacterized protein APZ42_022174 [Daphnia magna]|uniref:Uncharacterized protein n=1 Tax=Daphnia magna TaxID=35525 RepID=A0A164W2U1_9CRUS|nr:Uncharacterized protein APZ42_022174 [Daphnia magna]